MDKKTMKAEEEFKNYTKLAKEILFYKRLYDEYKNPEIVDQIIEKVKTNNGYDKFIESWSDNTHGYK